LIGLDLQGDVDNRWRDGHLKIETRGDGHFEPSHIVILDVPPILTEMTHDV